MFGGCGGAGFRCLLIWFACEFALVRLRLCVAIGGCCRLIWCLLCLGACVFDLLWFWLDCVGGVVFALLVCFWGFCCVVLSVVWHLRLCGCFALLLVFWLVFGVFFTNGLLVFSASWVVIACV